MEKHNVNEADKTVWDIFFAGIVTMAHCHPGAGVVREDVLYDNGSGPMPRLNLRECANLATEMIIVRQEVWGK